VGAYTRGPAFCWVHCQHYPMIFPFKRRIFWYHRHPYHFAELSWRQSIVLAKWWHAVRYGLVLLLLLLRRSIYSTERQTCDRQTPSQSDSTQLKAGNLMKCLHDLNWPFKVIPGHNQFASGVPAGPKNNTTLHFYRISRNYRRFVHTSRLVYTEYVYLHQA